MESHVQCSSEGSEEAGHELRAPVGGDVRGDSVLGEDVNEEELGEFLGSDGVVTWDENALLRGAVDDHQDRGESVRRRKVLDEVGGNGVPRTFRHRERAEKTVRAVARSLVTLAVDARPAVVANKCPDLRPHVLTANYLQRPVLAVVSGKNVVVVIAEDLDAKVVGSAVRTGNVDAVVEA